MKRVFRQSGDMLSTVTGSQRNSLDAPKPPFLAQVGRMGSKISLTSGEDIRLAPFTSTAEGSPSSTASRSSQRVSWHEESPDGDIEKRVLEMAGLGLGLSSSTLSSSKRRVKSEGVAHLSTAEAMVRSRAANDETGKVCVPDMTMLRRIANNPGNDRCADCSKGMKSSRWATLSKFLQFLSQAVLNSKRRSTRGSDGVIHLHSLLRDSS